MANGGTERYLKLGLRDEIGSVKETKIGLRFPILDFKIADVRKRAPNPAIRLAFHPLR
jgi:hypothetical protein